MKKRMLFHVILLLTLTWGGFSGCDNGEDIVTPPEVDTPPEVEIEPDSPSPEEQLAGLYDLIRFDYAERWHGGEGGGIWDDLGPPPLEPPIITGTLIMFAGDSFSLKWKIPGGAAHFSADKWEASTTNIFLDTTGPLSPDSISYTWQGTTRTTLIIKLRLHPNWPLWDPPEQIFVWKKK